MVIYDVHGVPIEPTWSAEFCGFFLADGDLSIIRYHRMGKNRKGAYIYEYYFYHPRAAIVQRDDNRPLLNAICQRLGGHVTTSNHRQTLVHSTGQVYDCKPRTYWYNFSKDGVRRVVNMLQLVQLPHRRLSEKLALMQEYLDTMRGPGHKYGDEVRAKIAALKDAVSATCKYIPPD